MQRIRFFGFFLGLLGMLSVTPFPCAYALELPVDSAPPVKGAALYTLSLQSLPFTPGLKVILSPKKIGKQGAFPRVAVFLQRPYVWIVSTEAITPDLSLTDFPPGYTSPEIIPNPEGFVIRLQIPAADFPAIDFDEKGTWSLSLGDPTPPHPFGSLPFLTGKLFAFLKEPSYLSVNLKDVFPVRLKNPQQDKEVIVIPTADPGVGFPGVFKYANFRLLQTLQGLVFDPSSPELTVSTGDFVKISQEGGLLLSPVEDRRKAQKEKETMVFLDFNAWQRKDLFYEEALKKLEEDVVKLPKEEHLGAQFKLAQFFLSHGFGEEAQAVLSLMRDRHPYLEEDGEFAALQGIAYFMTQEMLAALSTLSNPNLPAEVALWRGAALIKLGFAEQGAPLILNQRNALMNYPAPLKADLVLLAASGCLENEDKVNAESFLKMINRSALSSAQASFFASLQEELIILGMDPALRESYVVQVMKKGTKENPRIIADQDLVRIQERVKNKSLTPQTAIPLLEDLRTSWRGDALEFKVLQELATLYALEKNYFKAMESYGRALRFFPQMAAQQETEEKARDVFQKALNSSITPFRKIAFFNQYTSFLPTNDEKIVLVEELAQQLIELDLPDQAISILEKELDNKTNPRLLKYLADACLQDRQANKALRILNNPLLAQENQEEINYLRAQAYDQLKNFDKALTHLEGNETFAAQQLRSRIFGAQNNWAKAIEEFEKMMEQNENLDIHLLLQLTMALYMDENREALQKLRAQYQSKLSDNQEKNIFLLLTQPSYDGKMDLPSLKMALDDIKRFQEVSQQLLQGKVAP